MRVHRRLYGIYSVYFYTWYLDASSLNHVIHVLKTVCYFRPEKKPGETLYTFENGDNGQFKPSIKVNNQ